MGRPRSWDLGVSIHGQMVPMLWARVRVAHCVRSAQLGKTVSLLPGKGQREGRGFTVPSKAHPPRPQPFSLGPTKGSTAFQSGFQHVPLGSTQASHFSCHVHFLVFLDVLCVLSPDWRFSGNCSSWGRLGLSGSDLKCWRFCFMLCLSFRHLSIGKRLD